MEDWEVQEMIKKEMAKKELEDKETCPNCGYSGNFVIRKTFGGYKCAKCDTSWD